MKAHIIVERGTSAHEQSATVASAPEADIFDCVKNPRIIEVTLTPFLDPHS